MFVGLSASTVAQSVRESQNRLNQRNFAASSSSSSSFFVATCSFPILKFCRFHSPTSSKCPSFIRFVCHPEIIKCSFFRGVRWYCGFDCICAIAALWRVQQLLLKKKKKTKKFSVVFGGRTLTDKTNYKLQGTIKKNNVFSRAGFSSTLENSSAFGCSDQLLKGR